MKFVKRKQKKPTKHRPQLYGTIIFKVDFQISNFALYVAIDQSNCYQLLIYREQYGVNPAFSASSLKIGNIVEKRMFEK